MTTEQFASILILGIEVTELLKENFDDLLALKVAPNRFEEIKDATTSIREIRRLLKEERDK